MSCPWRTIQLRKSSSWSLASDKEENRLSYSFILYASLEPNVHIVSDISFSQLQFCEEVDVEFMENTQRVM